ncbi:MAG: amidohydrolase family protein [Candidatus Brockarchaeota archaeon]|nr:amidohydrolase family protein [Candidatus Brockarchaeota archaeon]
MAKEDAKRRIRSALDDMEVVDHHDHIGEPFMASAGHEADLPYFLANAYLYGDLVAAGMAGGILNSERFDYLKTGGDESAEIWKELKPYLGKVRNTIYYRFLLLALKDLYGFEGGEIEDGNWAALSRRIRERSKSQLKWSLEILEKMKVRRMILDISGASRINAKIIEDERLKQVVRMDDFITGNVKTAATFLERNVRTLDDYLEALEGAFETAVKQGAIGVKSGLAYEREILYERVPKPDAERIFASGLDRASYPERKAFQDFMMHEVCGLCAKHKLPFQVHTGLQAGNYNTISNANPTLLTNLIREFPGVRFDIFHGGYPYLMEAGILAKYFPNAYVDACWLAHISPTAYKRALSEWLEIVPASKIFAWGGDHGIIDWSYASLMLAKDLVADVLAEKVATNYFGEEAAIEVAEMIMGKNATEVYGF